MFTGKKWNILRSMTTLVVYALTATVVYANQINEVYPVLWTAS